MFKLNNHFRPAGLECQIIQYMMANFNLKGSTFFIHPVLRRNVLQGVPPKRLWVLKFKLIQTTFCNSLKFINIQNGK